MLKKWTDWLENCTEEKQEEPKKCYSGLAVVNTNKYSYEEEWMNSSDKPCEFEGVFEEAALKEMCVKEELKKPVLRMATEQTAEKKKLIVEV